MKSVQRKEGNHKKYSEFDYLLIDNRVSYNKMTILTPEI